MVLARLGSRVDYEHAHATPGPIKILNSLCIAAAIAIGCDQRGPEHVAEQAAGSTFIIAPARKKALDVVSQHSQNSKHARHRKA
jgi:hypothetical protein